jgi:hypothetical protein
MYDRQNLQTYNYLVNEHHLYKPKVKLKDRAAFGVFLEKLLYEKFEDTKKGYEKTYTEER